MSFAQVIQEAAVKRAERAAHAEHVAQVRRDELIEGARVADLQIDRRRRSYKEAAWGNCGLIDFKIWHSYILERKQAGDTYAQIAEHISAVENKSCSYRQISGVMTKLSKQVV